MIKYLELSEAGRTSLWHWLIAIVLIFCISIIGIIFIGFCLDKFSVYYLIGSFEDIDSPFSYLLMITSFVPIFLSIIVIQKLWFKRPIIFLFNSHSHFRLSLFLKALAIGCIIILVWQLLYVSFDDNLSPLEFNYFGIMQIMLIIFSLFLIPIQAAVEELFFRGLINKLLFKYLKNILAISLISSAVFALFHIPNTEAKLGFYYYLVYMFSYGLFSCYLVNRFQGLEVSIAFHLAMNFMGIIVINSNVNDMLSVALFESKTGLGAIDIRVLLASYIAYAVYAFCAHRFLEVHREEA